MTDDEVLETEETKPTEVRPPVSTLRWLVDVYYQTQKLRIQLGNRIAAVEREADEGPVPPLPASAQVTFDRLAEAEDALVKDMATALEGHPAMRWLSEVKGIGPTLGAKLLGLIGEIDSFTTVSKLWRFAGLAVIDGARERPVKGEKLHYSIRVKTVLYLIAGSFMKVKDSPYRAVYDAARAQYAVTRPTWTKGHQHLAALRRVEKLFLSHLWQVWREEKGLPTRAAYVIEKLGHTTVSDPWAFASKKKKAA
jgi:hypothetical protein